MDLWSSICVRKGRRVAGCKFERAGWLCAGVAGALAVLFLVSCATSRTALAPPPRIEGADFVGNSACTECHTNIARVFRGSVHARMHSAHGDLPGGTSCESCHGPASKHIQGGGGRGKFIVNPGRDSASCFSCHFDVHAQFSLPQHHPVPEGKMNCVQCHDPHGFDILKPARGLAMARLNESCADCHRDQSRPFVFEHEALREGCVVCHEPHGSINAKMLVERDNNLCLKCHAQQPGPAGIPGAIFIGREDHTDKLRLGGCWSAGCHTAVHGSNFNPHHLY